MAAEDSVSLENSDGLRSSVGDSHLRNMVLCTSDLDGEWASSNCGTGESQDGKGNVLNHDCELRRCGRRMRMKMRMREEARGKPTVYIYWTNGLDPDRISQSGDQRQTDNEAGKIRQSIKLCSGHQALNGR